MNAQQYEKVKSAKGFIAALDQSGGSTPKALSLYGIKTPSSGYGIAGGEPSRKRKRRR